MQCVRCGTCCLSCPCGEQAKLDNNGVCVYLSFNGKIASCSLIVKGKLDKNKEFKEGCGFGRLDPILKEWYMERAKKTAHVLGIDCSSFDSKNSGCKKQEAKSIG